MTPIQAMEDNQSGGIRRMVAANAEIAILVLPIVLFSILNPTTFLTVANFNTILNTAAVPTIIGVGATFVVLMGRIDLSVEGTMGAAVSPCLLLRTAGRARTGIWRDRRRHMRSARARTGDGSAAHAFEGSPSSFRSACGMLVLGSPRPVRPRDAAVSFRSGCPLVAHISPAWRF